MLNFNVVLDMLSHVCHKHDCLRLLAYYAYVFYEYISESIDNCDAQLRRTHLHFYRIPLIVFNRAFKVLTRIVRTIFTVNPQALDRITQS